jgi:hypothetical protein
MNRLTSNQRSFIELMKNGEDYERHGFELLLKRPDFQAFFDPLTEAGLFDPARNPGPVAADQPGYYRIPNWPPLAYLETAAKLAGEQGDAVLAEKLLEIMRNVSRWRDANDKLRDNYNTWSAFAKILGLLPTSAVSMADLDLIPAWLGSRFDRSMVGHSLTTGVLRNFLTSGNPGDRVKACRILYHCTAVEFVDGVLGNEKKTKEPRTLVDDFLLKDLINSSAAEFGRKAGKAAADTFLDRLKGVYAVSLGGRDTWVLRPAIEDHQQNYDWGGPHNRFVEGLRNTVLGWVDADPATARPYVESMLASGSEIVERIVIHLIDQRFEALRELVPQLISPAFFDSGHRHELHIFLKAHFRQFDGEEQRATLTVIRGLPPHDRGKHSERVRRGIQQNWLLAIAGKGCDAADAWLAKLASDLGSAALFPHPDFNSYHEARWGFGPTPHNIQELVAFAKAGTIVEQLNSFMPTNTWDGPSKRSLADAVVDAVVAAPETFINLLPQFLNANREYQYAVIAGFRKLWDAWDGKQPGLSWNEFWPKLVDFFEILLADPTFWEKEVTDEVTLSPTRDWIPPAISEFLRAGTRSDDKAYPQELFPRTRALVTILLEKSEPQSEPREGDALNGAINTAKGKAIEALLEHALRSCRLRDKAAKSHADAWDDLQPLFDAELARCQNANFEFSALAGAYIGNLYYMRDIWVDANFKKIFPIEFRANCLSALDGLAFAPQMQPIYEALTTSGVLDWALRQEMKGQHARETLLQRMGLAYLWNHEQLEGPRFAYLFETRRNGDLSDLAKYFWMIRGEPLDDNHKERIFLFWDRCITWAGSLDEPPASLLSQLSLLTCYLMAIDQRTLRWLMAVAPYASVNYNADRLIEELSRLAGASPAEVGRVLSALLKAYQPSYDFKDRLKKLIVQLAGHGESRDDAIQNLERVRHLPGMVQIYAQVT